MAIDLLPMRKSSKHEAYKEGMKQNWTQNSSLKTWSDQFGFVIYYSVDYRLEHKETNVTVHSLEAAKMISLIILNDKIMHRPIEPEGK